MDRGLLTGRSSKQDNEPLSSTYYETVHKQITSRQEHQTRTDDIHMRPHTV
jgi:hypothetical protein